MCVFVDGQKGLTTLDTPVAHATYWYNNAFPQYFCIWPANPVKLADGTWETYKGGVDVAF